LPELPAIFELIRKVGRIDDTEMYRVFNMGVGFVVIVPDNAADDALASINSSGYRAQRIGTVTSDDGIVAIEPAGLIGRLVEGESSFTKA
jgi:phosphoribosylformylglycinamidine cyclo-ligase